MLLTALHIRNLRVIEEATLAPGDGCNFVIGANGAGKTSVLEAIYLLGRGRSFRHSEAGPMIRSGASETLVTGHCNDPLTEMTHRIGISRGIRSFACRIDGADVRRRSELSAALPIQFISSQPQFLLEMGPDVRRRFVDLGVFHVEPGYVRLLAEYQRCLRQRNAALRQGNPEQVRPWDGAFTAAATAIHRKRKHHVETLAVRTTQLVRSWDIGIEPNLVYRQGWADDGTGLEDQLQRKLESDLRLGYTNRGPHRADLEVNLGRDDAGKKLSRGQQKMLVFAMNLAMVDLVADSGRSRPVMLIDDIAAELDPGNRKRVLVELRERQLQCFITAIEESALPEEARVAGMMFHVEQGQLGPC